MILTFTKASKKPIALDVLQLTDSLWCDIYAEEDHRIQINGYVLEAGFCEEEYVTPVGYGDLDVFTECRRAFYVNTLEDVARGKLHKAKINDWLIVGAKGEIYACDNEIFEETYTLSKRSK